MSEPEPIWVKSNWRVEQLDKKLIEFRLPLKDGGLVYGIEELWAASRSPIDDLLSVQIVKKQPTGIGLETRQTVFLLSQRYVDRIERHPDQNTAQFQLMMA
jgi:hypothetical protein